MTQMIAGVSCQLLVILAALFSFGSRSQQFNVIHSASVFWQSCQLSALLLFSVCNIVLWLQWHPSLSLCVFSPSSDSIGLSECSCDSVALRQKVAALWMWGKEKRKRLLPDCPGTKKETLFSFPTWPTWKKERGENARRRQRVLRKRGIAGHSAKKWNCLVWEPARRAGLKLEKFLKENSQPIKKKNGKKIRK